MGKYRALYSRQALEEMRPITRRARAGKKLIRPKVSSECKEPCAMNGLRIFMGVGAPRELD